MMTLINGILTALLLLIFVGVWAWAWSSRNRSTFESMAKLPLNEQPAEQQETGYE